MAKFYGIGTGPGDSELVTVKAVNTIKRLDISMLFVFSSFNNVQNLFFMFSSCFSVIIFTNFFCSKYLQKPNIVVTFFKFYIYSIVF